jgi:5-methylcytosine-specific restriction endonuclease McrA
MIKKKANKRKPSAPRKPRVPKTRNGGTMTESAFWSFIRSALRQKSRWWKPISECKANARRPYKGPSKRQKFEYKCTCCGDWFPEKLVNVDHIIPAGSLNCKEDLPGFVERLFCEQENLQVLCEACHNVKTKKDKDERD